MTESRKDQRLAKLLEEYHRRRALGGAVDADDFEETAGEDLDEFRGILSLERSLDEALAPADTPGFPMTFGDYTLVSELGRGAMGVVYEAIHRPLGRKVALKILQSGLDVHPVAIERFRREARACAQIRHDNVVRIHEAGEYLGRNFYAMELLPGRTLGHVAHDGDLPAPREFAASFAEVVDALGQLHSMGIIHRDIKPSNIMVEPTGRMILADFGLARTVTTESLTRTGEHLGTPLYMSPEQLLGSHDQVNARSDIYGLGATLYEVISGRPVFQTDDMRVLMRRILAERPEPLTEAPQEFARIVMKALEKENRDRYADAAAMRDDLRAFACGSPVQGRPVSAMRRFARRAWRTRVPILVVASVIACSMLAIALQPPAAARLTIACVPEANAFVGDADCGRTPLTIELAPGRYDVVLRREGWEERTLPLELQESERRTIEPFLVPCDPTDATSIAILAAAFDLRLEQWKKLDTQRAAWDESCIAILLPRGNVRLEDARTYLFRVGAEFREPGVIAFHDGASELFRRRVDLDWPENLTSDDPLPLRVANALQAGAVITWGFYPDDGEPITTAFQLVESEPPPFDKRLETLPPPVRGPLKAQWLLDRGLACAAFRRSVTVDTPPAHSIARAALQSLGLEDSPLWYDLAARTVDVSASGRGKSR